MPRFMLEGPRPCTIFLFRSDTPCMNYVTNMFLLVSSLNFDEFHNHSPTSINYALSYCLSMPFFVSGF